MPLPIYAITSINSCYWRYPKQRFFFFWSFVDQFHVVKLAWWHHILDSKVYGANMGPTWLLSTQMGPMLAPRILLSGMCCFRCGGIPHGTYAGCSWWCQWTCTCVILLEGSSQTNTIVATLMWYIWHATEYRQRTTRPCRKWVAQICGVVATNTFVEFFKDEAQKWQYINLPLIHISHTTIHIRINSPTETKLVFDNL